MGKPGSTPMLQVGGVQEAEITAADAFCLALTAPLVTVATSGLLVIHVRGGFDTMLLSVSTAVATMVFAPPAARVTEFPEPLWI